jgi:membrane-anchored glycerophosphoryl diester phosphodiesterase (GDPDase)
MDRLRTPTEFGFTTSPYLPPERPRPAWKTLVFGALLALIPFVEAGMSAVYIDRRTIPETYDTAQALKTALIQILGVALLVVLCWIVFGLVLGLSIQLNSRVIRRAA